MIKKTVTASFNANDASKNSKVIAIVVDPSVAPDTVAKFLECLSNGTGCKIIYHRNPSKITSFRSQQELNAFLGKSND